ncbi:hypothetical protein M0G74_17140 [Microbulbifer sp. CAU 1566]|uniref:hypothetical protein n=1 Tax=Microbulbifer sp. CAU 1566 TaxID=2933269 RepID=UPI0020042119|nr:hypothetical protein [Microbulbifer sp. CAU 1566]MCK7599002.1 hypothetical protein [Microbulbifer sp. CAU 1566]
MKFRKLHFPILAAISVFVAACSGPESPQDVTKAFWQAAVEGHAADVAEFSTLQGPERFDDDFAGWAGYQPSWGRVIIDSDEASVVSRFSSKEYPQYKARSFTTYLIQRDGEWLVDYERTISSARGDAFGDLLRQFDQLGKSLSEQFDRSAEQAGDQMDLMLEQLGREMEKAQGQMNEQATEAVENFSEELRKALEEMDKSLQRALEEEQEAPADAKQFHSTALRNSLYAG